MSLKTALCLSLVLALTACAGANDGRRFDGAYGGISGGLATGAR